MYDRSMKQLEDPKRTIHHPSTNMYSDHATSLIGQRLGRHSLMGETFSGSITSLSFNNSPNQEKRLHKLLQKKTPYRSDCRTSDRQVVDEENKSRGRVSSPSIWNPYLWHYKHAW
jgi:hypothetical protein